MVEWMHAQAWPTPSVRTVSEFEQELGVTLPIDFVAVATTYQDASPEPNGIDVPGLGVTGMDKLLNFNEDHGDNLLSRQWMAQDGLGDGIVPFALDVGGDLFCFDYRDTPSAPSAGFWSVDTGFVRLADGFTELVALLHP